MYYIITLYHYYYSDMIVNIVILLWVYEITPHNATKWSLLRHSVTASASASCLWCILAVLSMDLTDSNGNRNEDISVTVDLFASRIFMDFQHRLIRTESEQIPKWDPIQIVPEVCPGWRASNGSFHADGSDVIVATNPTSGTADAAITSLCDVNCFFVWKLFFSFFLHCAMLVQCGHLWTNSSAIWFSFWDISHRSHLSHRSDTSSAQGVRRISGDRSTQALFHRWILGCRDGF